MTNVKILNDTKSEVLALLKNKTTFHNFDYIFMKNNKTYYIMLRINKKNDYKLINNHIISIFPWLNKQILIICGGFEYKNINYEVKENE